MIIIHHDFSFRISYFPRLIRDLLKQPAQIEIYFRKAQKPADSLKIMAYFLNI